MATLVEYRFVYNENTQRWDKIDPSHAEYAFALPADIVEDSLTELLYAY